ncbi:MAG: alcohol dehydrogenase catalytic domain-containing protein [Thermoleophilaceae bacterium]|nr:alcohol dehydrogenase catalytic domain-containing protein [Thermoleophilaceae bacterium]
MKEPGMVFGHENQGIVEDVGPAVQRVKEAGGLRWHEAPRRA